MVKPHLFTGLSFAAGRVRTVLGTVEVAWERRDQRVTVSVRISVGAEAEVHLPLLGQQSSVLEGGKTVLRNGKLSPRLPEGVAMARMEKDRLVLQVGSGSYRFDCE